MSHVMAFAARGRRQKESSKTSWEMSHITVSGLLRETATVSHVTTSEVCGGEGQGVTCNVFLFWGRGKVTLHCFALLRLTFLQTTIVYHASPCIAMLCLALNCFGLLCLALLCIVMLCIALPRFAF